MTRRRTLFIAALMATAWGAVVPAHASDALTSQPLRMVVTFAPGGGTDMYARLIGAQLAKRGVQMIVENKPGGSGALAATTVARAKPDGRTFLLTSLSTLVSNTVLIDKLSYDPNQDFKGVTLIGYQPSILTARVDAPYKNIREMVAYAKAHPGKINRASPGAAILTNLAPAAFEAQYGFSTTHVPFNGDAPGLLALLSGQVDIVGSSITAPMQHVIDGRLRVLGVMGDKRLARFPDVETFKEQGYDFDGKLWYGLSVPSKTPAATIAELNQIINGAINDPEFQAKALAIGIEPQGSTAAEYDAYVRSEATRWLPQLRKIAESGVAK
jgi:tripartite-type tricarboxylate transporter receptor subunit TctC